MIKNVVGNRAAVIVPLYKEFMTTAEWYSFERTLSVLAKHDIYVICPYRLRDYISSLSMKTQSEFEVEYFSNKYFSGIDGYNKLLMSIGFYRRFDCYEYILIVQTDALVFTDQLNKWCDQRYSYIGAPWLKNTGCPEQPFTFLGVGNGGFSLRNVHDFLRVLYIPRYFPNKFMPDYKQLTGLSYVISFVRHRLIYAYNFPPLNTKLFEDHFWGQLVPERCTFFSVPRPEDSISFAFEVAPECLFELNGKQLPFGCHAWEKYNLPFWLNILSDENILVRT